MENQDSLKSDENTELEKESAGEDETEAKLKKAEELANNYKIRAEKAEALAKQLKKPEEKETPKNSEYSLKDIRALSDIHDEDVDEVVEFAKFKGISVAEAKKNLTIQNLLKAKDEERKTAGAANIGGSRHATSKATGESLLEKAESGQVPESDEDIRKLSEAKILSRKTT